MKIFDYLVWSAPYTVTVGSPASLYETLLSYSPYWCAPQVIIFFKVNVFVSQNQKKITNNIFLSRINYWKNIF